MLFDKNFKAKVVLEEATNFIRTIMKFGEF